MLQTKLIDKLNAVAIAKNMIEFKCCECDAVVNAKKRRDVPVKLGVKDDESDTPFKEFDVVGGLCLKCFDKQNREHGRVVLTFVPKVSHE